MELDTYRKIRTAIILSIVTVVAFGVIQNSNFLVVLAATLGIVALYASRRGLSEVLHDERTVLFRSKAASATLAIITVGMAIIGLSLILLNGYGIGNYEQIGYLLVYQACIVLFLNALLGYYYRNKLGG
jgi:uncharacterized membrane protein